MNRLLVCAVLACFSTSVKAQGPLAPNSWDRVSFSDSAAHAFSVRLDWRSLQNNTTARSGTVREMGLLIGILGVALGTTAVGEPEPLDCGPCNRADVPGFERWVIGPQREAWDLLSSAALLSVAGMTWVDVFNRPEGHAVAHFGASVESALLAFAATDLLKLTAGRIRPYAYAQDLESLDAVAIKDATRSWPSGHTSVAFALATSYWLSRGNSVNPTVKRVLAAATFLAGALRLPAGKHFPSDVVSGAALGIGSAFVVHAVRF